VYNNEVSYYIHRIVSSTTHNKGMMGNKHKFVVWNGKWVSDIPLRLFESRVMQKQSISKILPWSWYSKIWAHYRIANNIFFYYGTFIHHFVYG